MIPIPGRRMVMDVLVLSNERLYGNEFPLHGISQDKLGYLWLQTNYKLDSS